MSKTRNTFTEVGIKVYEKQVKEIKKLEEECATELINEIRSRTKMPPEYNHLPSDFYKYDNVSNFQNYVNSWNVESGELTTNEGNGHIVVNDYSVYWKKLGKNVAFGHFIEWGVGTAGLEDGNPYGYPYTLDPWDKATSYQQSYGLLTPYDPNSQIPSTSNFLHGARAVPHIHPSVEFISNKYLTLLKEKYK